MASAYFNVLSQHFCRLRKTYISKAENMSTNLYIASLVPFQGNRGLVSFMQFLRNDIILA